MKTGVELIAEERKIQIEKGYSLKKDLIYTDNELSIAASCYALSHKDRIENLIMTDNINTLPFMFPWGKRCWNPTPNNRIKELQKAGALIAAEIDRLQKMEGNNEK